MQDPRAPLVTLAPWAARRPELAYRAEEVDEWSAAALRRASHLAQRAEDGQRHAAHVVAQSRHISDAEERIVVAAGRALDAAGRHPFIVELVNAACNGAIAILAEVRRELAGAYRMQPAPPPPVEHPQVVLAEIGSGAIPIEAERTYEYGRATGYMDAVRRHVHRQAQLAAAQGLAVTAAVERLGTGCVPGCDELLATPGPVGPVADDDFAVARRHAREIVALARRSVAESHAQAALHLITFSLADASPTIGQSA